MFGLHLKRRLSRRRGIPDSSFDYFMDVVALLSPLALLPQVFEIFTTHDVSGLSLQTWGSLSVINTLWVAYGISRRSTPIIIANALFCTMNVAGVVGILLFS